MGKSKNDEYTPSIRQLKYDYWYIDGCKCHKSKEELLSEFLTYGMEEGLKKGYGKKLRYIELSDIVLITLDEFNIYMSKDHKYIECVDYYFRKRLYWVFLAAYRKTGISNTKEFPVSYILGNTFLVEEEEYIQAFAEYAFSEYDWNFTQLPEKIKQILKDMFKLKLGDIVPQEALQAICEYVERNIKLLFPKQKYTKRQVLSILQSSNFL